MTAFQTLVDYDIGKTLGQGTFGKVKLAFHKKVKEYVAVKILIRKRITEEADIQRITREIAILKAASHCNVVRLFEIVETPDQIYLFMEYAQRGDLTSYIREKGRLNEQEAAKLFMSIVEAVEYIHSIGVAHRDLKPSNILLTKDMQIKLADFGLSNMYKQGCKLNSPCGSPCYAAPEVIEGKAYEPICADIWSMGVILYIMIAGYLPYQHKNTHNLYKLILNARYEIPSNMSRLASDLVESIFKVDPTKRAKLREIKYHPWLLFHLNKSGPGPNIQPTNKIVINSKVMLILEKQGYKTQEILAEVKKNTHTGVCTLYHLYCLKTDAQLNEILVNLDKLDIPRLSHNRTMSINVRNPAEGSYSARKLLKRTPRNQNNLAARSKSKDKSEVFHGTFLKILKSNNTLSLNSSLSFGSQLNNTMNSECLQAKSRNLQRKVLERRSMEMTNYTSNTSIQRKISIDSKGGIKRRCSFIKKDPKNNLDTYNGPFNIDCIFNCDPYDLKVKIINYSKVHRQTYRQIEKWIMELKSPTDDTCTITINRLGDSQALILRLSNNGSSLMCRRLLSFLHSAY